MSSRSRIRAAWTFANAECDWGMMVTLTYRVNPEHPKADLKRLVRQFTANFGKRVGWGWMMEFQLRGTVHFHLFFSQRFVDRIKTAGRFWTEKVWRDGVETEIVRGDFDDWIVDRWLTIVGDTSPKFRAFQRGGICELMRSPDAAARYIAKECGKRAQKQLPDGVVAAGRWWWLSPLIKPRRRGTVQLERWPYERIHRLIFDTDDALKKEKQTPRERSLLVTTSYNICVAKSHAALRRKSEITYGIATSENSGLAGSDLAPPVPRDGMFDATQFGPPD